jgi:hypothetical protein
VPRQLGEQQCSRRGLALIATRGQLDVKPLLADQRTRARQIPPLKRTSPFACLGIGFLASVEGFRAKPQMPIPCGKRRRPQPRRHLSEGRDGMRSRSTI